MDFSVYLYKADVSLKERWGSMARLRRKQLYALLTAFVLLFCNLNPGTLAEQGGGEADNRLSAVCGMEEHEHTAECYGKELICGLEEREAETERHFRNTFKVHWHSDQCRDVSGKIACGIVEGTYYHTHNKFCKDENGRFCFNHLQRL